MTDTIRALTTSEVAERLHLNLRTVHRLIASGDLRAIRVGRVWRVPLQAVEEFLAGSGVVPTREGKQPRSEEERRARIDAGLGVLAHFPGSVDDFLTRKHEDKIREDERFQRRQEGK